MHGDHLRDLQAKQAEHPSRDGGCLIAEADPTVAAKAAGVLDIEPGRRAVLATNGAYSPMRHLGPDD